jgi:Replication-relaxation
MSGRRQAARVRPKLSDRDMAILAALRSLRLLTGGQLRRLFFTPGDPVTQARKARAAVKRLAELGVILRLTRRIGGLRAGSDGQVIALTSLGHAVVARDTDEPSRARSIINRKPAFQDHLLAVNELYVGLRERARDDAVELLDFQTEPACWRGFPGIGGQLVTLKPDAFVRLGVGDYEISAFIEQDQDTESLPTIARKCGVYLDYYRSGQEQHKQGVFPLVWWLVPSTKRLTDIAKIIRQHLPREAHTLFTVALHDEAVTRLTALPTGGSDA